MLMKWFLKEIMDPIINSYSKNLIKENLNQSYELLKGKNWTLFS